MSTELYQQYEEDFLNCLGNLTRTTDSMSTSSKGILTLILTFLFRQKRISLT